MCRRLLLPLLLLCLPGCDTASPPADTASPPAKVEIEEAWFQLPIVEGRPGAAYFTLRASADGVRLKRVKAGLARKVELHGPGMRRLEPADLAFQDRRLSFAPGGKHVMLLDMPADLIPCESHELVLHFEGAPMIVEPVLTRKIGDERCEEIYRGVTQGPNHR
jgi:hypothetical protein